MYFVRQREEENESLNSTNVCFRNYVFFFVHVVYDSHSLFFVFRISTRRFFQLSIFHVLVPQLLFVVCTTNNLSCPPKTMYITDVCP